MSVAYNTLGYADKFNKYKLHQINCSDYSIKLKFNMYTFYVPVSASNLNRQTILVSELFD